MAVFLRNDVPSVSIPFASKPYFRKSQKSNLACKPTLDILQKDAIKQKTIDALEISKFYSFCVRIHIRRFKFMN